jgi:hypothetical protein
MTECAIAVVQTDTAVMPDVVQRASRVNNKLAPLMLHCRQLYNKIAQTMSTGESMVQFYAQYHSYYWYLRQEIAQAQSDWSLFGLENYEHFDACGKRTVHRLCVLYSSVVERDQWVTRTLPIGETLKMEWDTTKKQIVQFYEQVRSQIPISVWNDVAGGGADVVIPDVEAYQPPPDKHSLLSMYSEKWEHVVLVKYPYMEKVVNYMERALSTGASTSTLVASLPLTTPAPLSIMGSNNNNNNGQYAVGISTERIITLRWLVSMIDPTSGTIQINANGCAHLKQYLASTQERLTKLGVALPRDTKV